MKELLFPRTKNLPVLGLDVRRKTELPRTQEEICPHCKGAGKADAACATDVSTHYQLVQLLHAFWWALRWHTGKVWVEVTWHTGKVWVWRICTSLVTLPWLIELARLIFSSTALLPSVSSKTLKLKLEVYLDHSIVVQTLFCPFSEIKPHDWLYLIIPRLCSGSLLGGRGCHTKYTKSPTFRGKIWTTATYPQLMIFFDKTISQSPNVTPLFAKKSFTYN